MALNNQTNRKVLHAGILLIVFVSLFFNPISALAMGDTNVSLPSFQEFKSTVQNENAGVLRGVYVDNVLALPVVQQPSGKAGYVSSNDGEVTQFGMASKYGNVGLLAHNHLSGRDFSNLAVGQEVRLVYGDGRVEYFIVTEVLQYQAMQPYSPYSEFRNLSNDTKLTAEQMFKKVYFGDRHVTFQTCIEAESNLSWGRLFVIAIPKEEYSKYDRLNP